MRCLLFFALAGWGASMALAATPIPTTASFAVNATVLPGCLVVGNTTQTAGVGFGMLDFGTHSAAASGTMSASLTASGGSMAQVQCTPGAAVMVTMDGGLHVLGSQRRLKMGANSYLPYALYISSSMSTPFQPGVGVSVDTSAGAMTLPVYGVATWPSGGLPGGQYSDTVQVVFSW
ncbi:spore coat U domain-containing protein [Rhodoferax sp.]|uniref:Csu type fimbrial protein n=1 Tax=Rhodoferax sp. TaxID=50421 RepID=UPI0025E370C0|nr:spore coat U domain-containing protein [Rhodoferax sp.]